MMLQKMSRCGRGRRYKMSSARIACAGSPGPMFAAPQVLSNQSFPSTPRITGRMLRCAGRRWNTGDALSGSKQCIVLPAVADALQFVEMALHTGIASRAVDGFGHVRSPADR